MEIRAVLLIKEWLRRFWETKHMNELTALKLMREAGFLMVPSVKMWWWFFSNPSTEMGQKMHALLGFGITIYCKKYYTLLEKKSNFLNANFNSFERLSSSAFQGLWLVFRGSQFFCRDSQNSGLLGHYPVGIALVVAGSTAEMDQCYYSWPSADCVQGLLGHCPAGAAVDVTRSARARWLWMPLVVRRHSLHPSQWCRTHPTVDSAFA